VYFGMSILDMFTYSLSNDFGTNLTGFLLILECFFNVTRQIHVQGFLTSFLKRFV